MCGATGAQNTLQAEDMATLQQYNDMMSTQYSSQTALLKTVGSVLDPILKAGPDQLGFSTAEENNLNAQVVSGTAQNYSSAAKAVGEQIASEGGGNVPISSGGAEELKAQLAESAARTESTEQAQVTAQNYATGRQNFQNAEEGEFEIARQQNPLGYAGAVTASEGAAGTQAEQIANENNSWYTAALGAAGGIAGHVIDQNPGNIFG